MSIDISTQYTKEQNTKCGRKGYAFSKSEKIAVISPMKYGIFVSNKRNKKRKFAKK